jgi:hypothetical protein
MAEVHPALFEMRREMKSPLWKVVNEHRPTWLKRSDAFVHPSVAPFQVVAVIQIVFVFAIAVVLGEIERWIGEHRINLPILDRRKQLHAIHVVHRSQIGAEGGFDICHVLFHFTPPKVPAHPTMPAAIAGVTRSDL